MGAGASPDHREEDGATADEIHQEEDLLPEHVVTGTLLAGLDDDVGHVGQDLQGGERWGGGSVGCVGVPQESTCVRPPQGPGGTCSGITIPKIFFSLSDSTYLTKAQPEPIKAMVMKRRAPFSLGGGVRVVRGAVPAPPSPPPTCHGEGHSQVRDVVHDSEAFDGVALAVDEVVVDLEADGRTDSQTDRWTWGVGGGLGTQRVTVGAGGHQGDRADSCDRDGGSTQKRAAVWL